jgi:malate synthase
VTVEGLKVAESLYRFVVDEALPGSGVDPDRFWSGAASLIAEFVPRNRDLLERRAHLQSALDDYHRAHPGPAPDDYPRFLASIGYLTDAPEPFIITTGDSDAEVSSQPGPQLVVPLLNARFAVNAANARWGSLYDALYGTDVIDETGGHERGGAYNPARGAVVVARGREFLDATLPLARGSHADVTSYRVDEAGLVAELGGEPRRLADASAFVGFRGPMDEPEALLLVQHGLHVAIELDRSDRIGSADAAGVKDIVLEAAVSTIMDLEDSVAAVDATDKVLGYRNWLQLMQGRLTAEVTKAGRTFTRRLDPDREYVTPGGDTVTLPGRSLLLLRHVGLLMTTDAMLDADGNEVPEGLVDALVANLASLHDLRGDSALHNSRTGSIYVVKPKMHGPDEVRFSCDVFARVEALFDLPAGTIKIGIMDEERRTSVNLLACVAEARDRIAFINTGFLDRTGDELHTSMWAGPMVRKAAMKSQPWIRAYEDNNVDVGLACGLAGRAQIGKGMWAAPDNMADMLEQKIGHPLAGATCAWVPSPTAATLHALHYHQVDVLARQRELAGRASIDRNDLLTLPLVDPDAVPDAERQAELDNNVQGVLGYLVRWIDAGVGCSKVPDITGTPLMEDRATCRISSQHIANWLLHGLITNEQLDETLRRMAAVVDEQNAGDPGYEPMAPSFDGVAFAAARELIVRGLDHPSGYTEPTLHAYRKTRKARDTEKGSG